MKRNAKEILHKCCTTLLFCVLLVNLFVPNVTVNAATLKTDVSTPSNGCILIGIKGSYLGGAQKALDRINKIRKEACKEGVINPSTGKKLKPSDYVPIKWSSSLEYIARIRAAEASLTMGHVRTNGSGCFDISAPDGMSSRGEVLAWNWDKSMVSGVNQWYIEKKAWVKQNPKAVTGHYTSMIDPQNTFVGLAAFYTKQAEFPNTVAGEFFSVDYLDYADISADSISHQMAKPVSSCVQMLEIPLSSLKRLSVSSNLKSGKNARVYGVLSNNQKYILYKGKWSSSDTSILTVGKNGYISPKKTGKAIVSVQYGSKKYKIKVTVR